MVNPEKRELEGKKVLIHNMTIIHFIHCIEVRFASLLSGGFTTMAVIDPPEKKLANRTSV